MHTGSYEARFIFEEPINTGFEDGNPIPSHDILSSTGGPKYQVWRQGAQWFRGQRSSGRGHSKVQTLPVTLTFKTAVQTFRTKLRLVMNNRHVKLTRKTLSGSEDIKQGYFQGYTQKKETKAHNKHTRNCIVVYSLLAR